MNIVKYIVCFCLAASAPASALQYVSFGGGTDNLKLTNTSDSGLKVGYMGSARVGYLFEQYSARAEFEVSYRKSAFSTQYVENQKNELSFKHYRNFHSWAYMFNLHYDANQISVAGIVPYIGAGIGYCQNTEHHKVKYSANTDSEKLRDNRFAYQGMLGITYPINEQYKSSIEYHYFCGQQHAKSHSVNLLIVRNF